MTKFVEYRFKIDKVPPDTLSMARFAEYLGELARLLGNQDCVHFSRVEEGSAVLVRIELDTVAKVRDRIGSAKARAIAADAGKAYDAINTMLKKDNAVAAVTDEKQAEVIRFPGRETPQLEAFGPFRQRGSLYGELVSTGGIDEIVPARIRDQDQIWHCNTTPQIARNMGRHLLGPTLRVDGTGRWIRAGDGSWKLQHFRIDSFEVLPDESLAQVVDALQAIEGSEWGNFEDPFEEARTLRAGFGEDGEWSPSMPRC